MTITLCTRRTALLAPLAMAATAQTVAADTTVRLATAEATADAAPSTQAIASALRKVQSRTPTYTGAPDIDGMRALVPLLEGSLAIAAVIRNSGEDPDTRQMAQRILTQRQAELDWMRDWLRQHDR